MNTPVEAVVLDWLLNSDPSLRWQVLRDLTDASASDVKRERARVAIEGWGARLLALRGDDGLWAGGACFPADFQWDFSRGQPWTSTFPTLMLLREFGVDPDDETMRPVILDVREHCRWEHAGQAFFDGEVEPCINGRTIALGAYFDVPVDHLVERVVHERLGDGGWNCESESGSERSSFHTTICVLEGLLAFEQATGGTPTSLEARRSGEEYLLERRLLRRLSTGEVVNDDWLKFSFPTQWHYDVLRGLEYFRSVGDPPDSRLDEAISIVRQKRQSNGTWLLENSHPGAMHFTLEGDDGLPSRWNTLRALRTLAWFEDGSATNPRQHGQSTNDSD